MPSPNSPRSSARTSSLLIKLPTRSLTVFSPRSHPDNLILDSCSSFGEIKIAYEFAGAIADHERLPHQKTGPNGRNKMVINHLDKLFVTSDAATIIRELEVVHPAGKVLVMASQQQEHEVSTRSATRSILVVMSALWQL